MIQTPAPAKVNLRLEVLGKRSDGYHEIRSLAVAVGVFDRLRFAAAPAGCLELTCNDASVPADERNLIVQAARLLARRTGTEQGARIELDKGIGVGAGLGGGSSDAAATLLALNELWQTEVAREELTAWGAELGSDIPLFFSLPAVVVGGRGERTSRVRLRWSGWAVLVFGDELVSTREVYRAWRAEDSQGGSGTEIERMIEATSAQTLAGLAVNDLEPAVFRICPAVERLHDCVRATGLHVRVSGAGSTLFALFDQQKAAAEAAAELRRSGLRCMSVGAADNAMTNQDDGQRDDKR